MAGHMGYNGVDLRLAAESFIGIWYFKELFLSIYSCSEATNSLDGQQFVRIGKGFVFSKNKLEHKTKQLIAK